nr:MAG TPA: hypothetical protein [Caudoviricetes sp.]
MFLLSTVRIIAYLSTVTAYNTVSSSDINPPPSTG